MLSNTQKKKNVFLSTILFLSTFSRLFGGVDRPRSLNFPTRYNLFHGILAHANSFPLSLFQSSFFFTLFPFYLFTPLDEIVYNRRRTISLVIFFTGGAVLGKFQHTAGLIYTEQRKKPNITLRILFLFSCQSVHWFTIKRSDSAILSRPLYLRVVCTTFARLLLLCLCNLFSAVLFHVFLLSSLLA